MKKVIKLTESDLKRLVEKVLEEQKNVKVVLCKNIGITDGHKYCNGITKTKIVQIECGALGLTDPNSRGKFGGHRVIKGMCSGKDGKPINEMVTEQKKDEKKDEEVSWLWKVKKKLKGISDEQLDYNMRNDLPWDWKGTKEGYFEKMEPRKRHSGSN